MKILGIDYGDKNIGLAIYEDVLDFIYPYKTISRKKSNIWRKSINEIIDIINLENIEKIVIGLPLNMDGTYGERAELVKLFSKKIKDKLINQIEIDFEDERLTTFSANEILNEIKSKHKKEYIDQLSAVIILEQYKNNKKGD